MWQSLLLLGASYFIKSVRC